MTAGLLALAGARTGSTVALALAVATALAAALATAFATTAAGGLGVGGRRGEGVRLRGSVGARGTGDLARAGAISGARGAAGVAVHAAAAGAIAVARLVDLLESLVEAAQEHSDEPGTRDEDDDAFEEDIAAGSRSVGTTSDGLERADRNVEAGDHQRKDATIDIGSVFHSYSHLSAQSR